METTSGGLPGPQESAGESGWGHTFSETLSGEHTTVGKSHPGGMFGQGAAWPWTRCLSHIKRAGTTSPSRIWI